MSAANVAPSSRIAAEENDRASSATNQKAPVSDDSLLRVALAAIGPHPEQPRTIINEEKLRELMASIVRLGGLLHPIDIRPSDDEAPQSAEPLCEYRLIAGQRRLEAYRRLLANAKTTEDKARWSTIPAIVKTDVDEAEALEQAVIENIQREELAPLDEAEAYARIKRKRSLKSAKDVAAIVGKREDRVRRLLQLNDAPPVVKKALRTGLTVTAYETVADEGGTRTQERKQRERRLDYLEALEFTQVYEHFFQKHGGFRNAASTAKAEEATRKLMERALTEGWGLRRTQEVVECITRDPSQASTALPARVALAPFTSDEKKLVVYRARLREAGAEQVSALRHALKTILAELG